MVSKKDAKIPKKNREIMTNEELKKLEADLWDSANTLRATGGIKSADYAVPVLGIFWQISRRLSMSITTES